MDMSDIIYILFLAICVWLAMYWDDDGGGGHRSRLRAAISA
jgi:hypothetical protein